MIILLLAYLGVGIDIIFFGVHFKNASHRETRVQKHTESISNLQIVEGVCAPRFYLSPISPFGSCCFTIQPGAYRPAFLLFPSSFIVSCPITLKARLIWVGNLIFNLACVKFRFLSQLRHITTSKVCGRPVRWRFAHIYTQKELYYSYFLMLQLSSSSALLYINNMYIPT